MLLGLGLHFAIETAHIGMSRDFLGLEGARLNFPAFSWSVSYSILKLLMFYKNNSTLHTRGNKHIINTHFFIYFIFHFKIVYPGYKFSINILFYNRPCKN